jgi:hypothetical protein
MNGSVAAPLAAGSAPAAETPRGWWLRGLWIYAIMVAAGLLGVAFTSTGGPSVTGEGPSLITVWGMVIPIYFAACVWQGWESAAALQLRFRLVATQALHWLAFLGAMLVVNLSEVRGIVNDDAEGVTLLLLLAMGTFVAGVHAWSLPICLTGLVLAVAIPLIAWIEATAVLLALLTAGAVLTFAVLWFLWRRFTAPPPALA